MAVGFKALFISNFFSLSLVYRKIASRLVRLVMTGDNKCHKRQKWKRLKKYKKYAIMI
ncbi:hypothetical protein ABID29_000622 [Streptococcus rupicaprae]|uniref:Uncharacterized protein n=1 Tax=Streptococcus rupicaprae TaxID=759619 RepID=A0ABV2FG24_9STRE